MLLNQYWVTEEIKQGVKIYIDMKDNMAYESHLTPVRMATINKSTNSKCQQRMDKGEHLCTIGENAD